MKTRKRLLYVITLSFSMIFVIILSGVFIFSSPRKQTVVTRSFSDLEAVCDVIGVEKDYINVHGLPMASYKNTSNVCTGEKQEYYPTGVAINVLVAAVISSIPTTLIIRYLHKK